MKMVDKFAKIHKAFCDTYNFDDTTRYKPNQKEYKALKKEVEKILFGE